MMRKISACMLVLVFVLSLLGCARQGETETNDREPVPISADSISENVYDALREEWLEWGALGENARMVSSHMPGYCYRNFENWEECEDFLGLTIPNDMEDCAWLEKATYVGMPIGFADAPRVTLTWYGTEDGHVEWISASAGYRYDQVRVMVRATLYGDSVDATEEGRGWTAELERQTYLSQDDSSAVQISSKSTEAYFAKEAYVARDSVLYHINIVGECEAQTEVEETFTKVIDTFFSFSD